MIQLKIVVHLPVSLHFHVPCRMHKESHLFDIYWRSCRTCAEQKKVEYKIWIIKTVAWKLCIIRPKLLFVTDGELLWRVRGAVSSGKAESIEKNVILAHKCKCNAPLYMWIHEAYFLQRCFTQHASTFFSRCHRNSSREILFPFSQKNNIWIPSWECGRWWISKEYLVTS